MLAYVIERFIMAPVLKNHGESTDSSPLSSEPQRRKGVIKKELIIRSIFVPEHKPVFSVAELRNLVEKEQISSLLKVKLDAVIKNRFGNTPITILITIRKIFDSETRNHRLKLFID